MSGPVRSLQMSRRSLTGYVSMTSGDAAAFESSLERDLLISLDFMPSVLSVEVQPFKLAYYVDEGKRTYTPDVKAVFDLSCSHGRQKTVIYEVKPSETLKEQWTDFQNRFRAANSYCRERGWIFRIVTEQRIRTPFLKNATFLRRYIQMPDQPLIRMQLIYTLQSLGPVCARDLLVAAYPAKQQRMNAIAVMWGLVASRQLITDLSVPLTMQSILSLADEI